MSNLKSPIAAAVSFWDENEEELPMTTTYDHEILKSWFTGELKVESIINGEQSKKYQVVNISVNIKDKLTKNMLFDSSIDGETGTINLVVDVVLKQM